MYLQIVATFLKEVGNKKRSHCSNLPVFPCPKLRWHAKAIESRSQAQRLTGSLSLMANCLSVTKTPPHNTIFLRSFLLFLKETCSASVRLWIATTQCTLAFLERKQQTLGSKSLTMKRQKVQVGKMHEKGK